MGRKKKPAPASQCVVNTGPVIPECPKQIGKPWWQVGYEEKLARDVYALVTALRGERVLWKQVYERALSMLGARGHEISEHKVKRLYLAGRKLHLKDQSCK